MRRTISTAALILIAGTCGAIGAACSGTNNVGPADTGTDASSDGTSNSRNMDASSRDDATAAGMQSVPDAFLNDALTDAGGGLVNDGDGTTDGAVLTDASEGGLPDALPDTSPMFLVEPPDGAADATGDVDETSIRESGSPDVVEEPDVPDVLDEQAPDADTAPVPADDTQRLLFGRAPSCLACAINQNSCLGVDGGDDLTCDVFAGDQKAACLAQLSCILATSPLCGVTAKKPTCLCGASTVATCEADAGAVGACASQYFAAFGTHDVTTIVSPVNFLSGDQPGGVANLLVQCLDFAFGPCSSCFAE